MDQLISLLRSLMSWCWPSESGSSEPARSVERSAEFVERSFEVVAIGLNERSKFSGEPPKAKKKYFRPRDVDGVKELSTFSVDGLSDEARWTLLDAQLTKAPIPARSELRKDAFAAAGLQQHPDWEPERHVNIIGWPASEDAIDSAAQVLYAHQSCVRRSESPAGEQR